MVRCRTGNEPAGVRTGVKRLIDCHDRRTRFKECLHLALFPCFEGLRKDPDGNQADTGLEQPPNYPGKTRLSKAATQNPTQSHAPVPGHYT